MRPVLDRALVRQTTLGLLICTVAPTRERAQLPNGTLLLGTKR
jgi:hypothetical protein